MITVIALAYVAIGFLFMGIGRSMLRQGEKVNTAENPHIYLFDIGDVAESALQPFGFIMMLAGLMMIAGAVVYWFNPSLFIQR